MKKRLIVNFASVLLAGIMFVSCGEYTANEYVDDLRDLTEDCIENASDYTDDDWKEIIEDFMEINAKAVEACKNLTKEQAKEIKKLKKQIVKEISKIDSKAIEKELDNITEQTGDALKDLFD